jgi:hypothetical protein
MWHYWTLENLRYVKWLYYLVYWSTCVYSILSCFRRLIVVAEVQF